jgi:hypothetical protein
MASTRTPLEALNYVKRFLGNPQIDSTDGDLKIKLLNEASNRIHTFAPWRWAVGAFTQETVVNDQEDYTVDAVTDASYLVKAELREAGSNSLTPLTPVALLPSQTQLKGDPEEIYWDGSTTLRLSPVPTGFESGAEPVLISHYKKENVEIVETGAGAGQADDDSGDAFLFDDEWFWVYVEVLKELGMQMFHDDRLGSMTVTGDGQVQFTGQVARVQWALRYMYEREKAFLGDLGVPING